MSKLFGTINGKKIGVLGFAFKAKTNDTRDSSAIPICKDLLNEGSYLIIYDPKVTEAQIAQDLSLSSENYNETQNSEKKSLEVTNNIYDVFNNTDCVVVMTEWKEFSDIDWNLASKEMRKPGWVFDTRNIVDQLKVKKSGLNLWVVGRND